MSGRKKIVLASIAAIIVLGALGVGLALTVGSSRAQNIRACSNDIFRGAELPKSVRKNICTCEYEYVEWLSQLAGLYGVKYDAFHRGWFIEGGTRVGESDYALCTPATIPWYLR